MKIKTTYVCQECGHRSPKWMGRCPDCQQWNCFAEEALQSAPKGKAAPATLEAPKRLSEVAAREEDRVSCRIAELDRVFGGGIVPGSFALLGGDPGIGKSTLLLQAVVHLAAEGKALYVTAEESAHQVKLRAQRLGAAADDFYLLSETNLEAVQEQVKKLQPEFLVIDSIQTISTNTLESAPGSVSQVRECAAKLMRKAKAEGLTTFIVGHVTKDGSIAGPRVLEHMVDTVLYFEGDGGNPYRILRAVKNRFGSTNEIGVFEMKEGGLSEVANPSELFLAERPKGVSGSVVVPSMEGSRPILVELQALVSTTSYGTPQRTSLGIDRSRLSLLLAILEKRVGLSLLSQDVFLNVAGGVSLDEPAVDLAIAAALASSLLDRPVPERTLVFGEVGLAAEVRAINRPELRVGEAARLGFDRCFLPAGNMKNLDPPEGLRLMPVKSVEEMLEALFDRD